MFLEKLLRAFKPKENKKVEGSFQPGSFFEGYRSSRAPSKNQIACFAPLKNIYFGHQGKAVACCYNRFHVLGTYPAQSIEEIWNGEKVAELRQALKKYDFSHGCLSCLSQIKAGNFDATKARQYDEQRLNENGFPSVMEFELDNTCNLECIMCSGDFSSLIRKNREGKPPIQSPYDDKFVEQLSAFVPYLEEVKFYGGEPFMIDIYYKIWDLIVSINPEARISIQTNATMLNSRIKDLLEKGNFHINISLDSVDKEVYEGIRVNAKFEVVMANVEWLIDYCHRKDTFIGISACAMRQNWRDIPNILSFCNHKKVQLYLHTVFYPNTSALRLLSSGELDEIFNYYTIQFEHLPESSPLEKKNKAHITGYVRQISDWRQAAPAKNVPTRILTPTNFLKFIESQLLSQKFKSSFDDARRDNILKKIRPIVAVLPQDFDISVLTKDVNFDDEFNVHDMIMHIENEQTENFLRNLCPQFLPIHTFSDLSNLTHLKLCLPEFNSLFNEDEISELNAKLSQIAASFPTDMEIGEMVKGINMGDDKQIVETLRQIVSEPVPDFVARISKNQLL